MSDESDDKLNQILALEKSPRSPSYEKIVGAVITLIVTSACLWVGTTVTTMSKELIELRVIVSEQGKQLTTFIVAGQRASDGHAELNVRMSRLEVEVKNLQERQSALVSELRRLSGKNPLDGANSTVFGKGTIVTGGY